MLIVKDDLRQQIISDFLVELDHFERTAEKQWTRTNWNLLKQDSKKILQQLTRLAIIPANKKINLFDIGVCVAIC
jgi:hypothetical protein